MRRALRFLGMSNFDQYNDTGIIIEAMLNIR